MSTESEAYGSGDEPIEEGGVEQTYREMEQRAWETAEKSGFHAARGALAGTWQADAWRDIALATRLYIAGPAELLRDAKTQDEFLAAVDAIEEPDDDTPCPPWKADLYCSLVLMVTEVAEAIECLDEASSPSDLLRVTITDKGKPEGFAVELADTVIRIMDTMYNEGMDGADAIAMKQAYNLMRPFMHGRGA